MGDLRRGDCDTALVVDRSGVGGALRVRMGRAFFCGAQQAGDVRASVVVVVGGSEDGGDDDRGEDGGGGQKGSGEWQAARKKRREWNSEKVKQ